MGNAACARLPGDVVVKVASHLSGTEARESLNLFRVDVDRCTADRVWLALADVCCKPTSSEAQESDASRVAKLARRNATQKRASPKQEYWVCQSKICESCFSRPSCVRRACGLCAQEPERRTNINRGHDVCCSCVAASLLPSDFSERRQRLRAAGACWAASPLRAVFSGIRLPSTPPFFGEVLAGRLVNAEVFERVEADFWTRDAEARAAIRADLPFFWASVGRLDQETLRRCDSYAMLSDEREVAKTARAANPFAMLARRALRKLVRRMSEDVETRVFLELADQAAVLVKQAVCLLMKIDRIGVKKVVDATLGQLFDFVSRDYRDHGTRFLRDYDSGEEFARRKSLFAPSRFRDATVVLDALGLAMLGSSISDPDRKVPTKFALRIKGQLFRAFGLQVLADTKTAAEELVRRLSHSREIAPWFDLLTEPWRVTREALQSIGIGADLRRALPRQGGTFAEVWCSCPELVRAYGEAYLVQESDGSLPDELAFEGFVDFLSVLEKLDPRRNAEVVAMSRRVEAQLEEDGSDEEMVKVKVQDPEKFREARKKMNTERRQERQKRKREARQEKSAATRAIGTKNMKNKKGRVAANADGGGGARVADLSFFGL